MTRKHMVWKASVAIVVALVFILPGSAAFANPNPPAGPLTNTIVSISPPTQDVDKWETFTVDVYVEPGESIMGMNVNFLAFNPALIQAISVTQGNLFAGHDTFWIGGTIDNVLGQITLISVVTIPAWGATNPGTFCTITFTAKDLYGTSLLVLGGTVVASYPSGTPGPVTTFNGDVCIPVPQYTLTMNVVGVGTTVPAAPGAYMYDEGTVVPVTAIETDPANWTFAGWSGDVPSGHENDNPVNITMDADKEITATFSGLGWDATMTFEASITSNNIDTVVFGESVDALDGIDAMDLPKPDAPPVPYLYTYLATQLADPYDILWEEYRYYDAANDYQIYQLYVELDTGHPREFVEVTITWDSNAINLAQYDFVGLYNAVSGNLLADMKATGTYVYWADSGMANHFHIICSDNHAPVANNDAYSTFEAHALTVIVPGILGNDVDVDGDTLTAVLETDVSDGILTLHAGGSFEYTPDLGFTGTDSFTYKANDGDLDSNIATVEIEVLALNHITVQHGWNLISMPVGEPIDKTMILVRSGGTDYTWAYATTHGICSRYLTSILQ